MPRTAIIEPAISQWVAEARAMLASLHDAEEAARKLEKKLTESREAAQMRRYELGAYLLKVRDQMPRRGTKETGWKAFLEAIEVDDSTAHRYMELARTATSHGGDLRRSDEPQVREGALPPDAPPPSDDDAPRELAVEAGVPQDEVEIDRDTWCTPKSLADALGQWDLDPCSNERSHVQATRTFLLEQRGEDGIVLAPTVKKNTRAFLNPPYSHVMPWIEAYAHTRFCFLLKFDCSTRWFETLVGLCEVVLLPRRTRIQFEPPPGVPPEKALANQFPHALFYARDEDVSDAIRDLCFPPWRIR